MVATWKKDLAKEITKGVKAAKTIGVVKIDNIPSKQMQQMRKTLRGKANLVIAKRNVLKQSFSKANLEGLSEYLDGSVGLLSSDLDPFQLEKLVYSCRTNAPAKAGATAPCDIIVPAGDTGLPAGPVIGDIQGAGIKAKIQGGKIIVQQESVVVKEGDPISEEVATALMRLKIQPMNIGLDLKAVWNDNVVYPYEVLHIEEAETISRLQSAHVKAFNLAFNAGLFMPDTVRLFIQEAFCNARNLAINAEVINKDTVDYFIGRADAQAKALKSVLPDDIKPAEEPVKEEAKPEEVKETPAEEKKETPSEDNKGEAPAEGKV
ncbi:MAG: 50S ribosomal protein L10 [Candidatus Altiarchaeota archaeon]